MAEIFFKGSMMMDDVLFACFAITVLELECRVKCRLNKHNREGVSAVKVRRSELHLNNQKKTDQRLLKTTLRYMCDEGCNPFY